MQKTSSMGTEKEPPNECKGKGRNMAIVLSLGKNCLKGRFDFGDVVEKARSFSCCDIGNSKGRKAKLKGKDAGIAKRTRKKRELSRREWVKN